MSNLSVNGARGEVAVTLDGRDYKLCLTLGALAEMETSLGCVSLHDLEGRMKAVSAADLVAILTALLRGGGEMEAASQLSFKALDTAMAARAVMRAFGVASASAGEHDKPDE